MIIEEYINSGNKLSYDTSTKKLIINDYGESPIAIDLDGIKTLKGMLTFIESNNLL